MFSAKKKTPNEFNVFTRYAFSLSAASLTSLTLSGCSVSLTKDCSDFTGKSVSLSMYIPRDADGRALPSPERDEWAMYVIENGEGCAKQELVDQALSYLN